MLLNPIMSFLICNTFVCRPGLCYVGDDLLYVYGLVVVVVVAIIIILWSFTFLDLGIPLMNSSKMINVCFTVELFLVIIGILYREHVSLTAI